MSEYEMMLRDIELWILRKAYDPKWQEVEAGQIAVKIMSSIQERYKLEAKP